MEETEELEIELPDSIILAYSLEAHKRNITLNDMFIIALEETVKSIQYRFEHQDNKQLLLEFPELHNDED
jgi:hypothetical protein